MGDKFIFRVIFSEDCKKIEMLAFNNKIKIVKAYIPDKVKLFIETNLSKELSHFQKKYSYKIDFVENGQLIIPEYRIELLNKSKKVINKIENINEIKKYKSNLDLFEKKNIKSEKKKSKNIS